MDKSINYLKTLFLNFPGCLHILVLVVLWIWIFILFKKKKRNIQTYFFCLLIYLGIYLFPVFSIYFNDDEPAGWVFIFAITIFPILTIYQVVIIMYIYISEYFKSK